MQAEVIEEYTLAQLTKGDFNESIHLLPSSSVDAGFATEGILKKLVHWKSLRSVNSSVM